MNHKATIIGLGVMGQRMLGNMAKYPGFDAVTAWDPDADACARTAQRYPEIRIAADAGTAIADPETTVVYVASPPVSHREHALAAMDAGKAVYCEKPLGVDVAQSRGLADAAKAAGVVNIVNFSLASALATTAIEKSLAAGECGDVLGVDIVLHFSQWPRAWQVDAASWLAKRAEGGFAREVLSHWVYLSERLFGAATLDRAWARYPQDPDDGAETHLQAALRIGALPVTVAGSVGGAGPDRVEYTVYGSRASCRIVDWNRLYRSEGGEWQADLTHIADPREAGYEAQLAHAARAVAGESHTMPDFEAALSVQALVEAMLAGC
jgi:predicted dehydrogenase